MTVTTIAWPKLVISCWKRGTISSISSLSTAAALITENMVQIRSISSSTIFDGFFSIFSFFSEIFFFEFFLCFFTLFFALNVVGTGAEGFYKSWECVIAHTKTKTPLALPHSSHTTPNAQIFNPQTPGENEATPGAVQIKPNFIDVSASMVIGSDSKM